MYVRPRISGTQSGSIFARYVLDLQLSVKQHGASAEAVAEATALMQRIFLGLSPTNARLLRKSKGSGCVGAKPEESRE
jgi:hypothetical protein